MNPPTTETPTETDAPVTPRRHRASAVVRKVALALAWLLVAMPLVIVVSRLLDLDHSSSFLYAAQSVGLWLFAPVYVVVIAAAITRHRLLLVVAVVTCLLQGVLIWPEVTGGNPAASEAAVEPITVATANLHGNNTDPDATVTAIAGIDADLLFLEELTPELLTRLEESGAVDDYDESVLEPQSGTGGAAIYSKYEFEWSGVEQVADRWWPTAVVLIEGTEVELLSVHTTQPLAGLLELNQELDEVGVWARDADVAAIYAGDFNASTQHSGFDELLDGSPLRDAHQSVGRGLARSWPSNRWYPPFVLLDHVLVSDEIAVDDVSEVELPGSDHLAVVAELRIP